MTDGMLSVIQHRNPFVQTGKQIADGQIFHTDIGQNFRNRQHFTEQESATQSRINSCNRTVSSIHSADDVHILRNTEQFLRIG